MKQLYKINADEFLELMNLQRPIPVMMTHVLPPEVFDPQILINMFWMRVGKKYGFDPATMEAPAISDVNAFMATPVNN